MTAKFRQALRSDIPSMWDVRYAVIENKLPHGRISDEEVQKAIEDTGRGWVVEDGGRIQGFAIGNAESGNIWALFVLPGAQGRGYGSQLHDEMVAWLRAKGAPLLWLTTGAATKACSFYEHRGWKRVGMSKPGEARYEMRGAP